MDKHQVATILDEIASLLELQGENPFRAGAYSKAARAISQLESNLADVVSANELDTIPGIGATLKDKITTLVTTGSLPFYEDLKKKTPPGLIKMMRLPSVGPKKIKQLYDDLGIDSMEKLQEACTNGSIAKLKGFGEKTQAKILEGIAFVDQLGDRVRIDQASFLANSLADELKKALKAAGIPYQRFEICGSLRRRKETVGDLDFLISADNAAPIMETFVKLPQVQKIIGQGDTKASVQVAAFDNGSNRIIMNADLRVVSDAQFPFALNYFTGSKEHNVALRQRAIQYKLKLNEYALAGADKSIPCKDEADIYRALDLDYVPAELRENTGEVDAAAHKKVPKLIEYSDLKGVFHCHSTWSDGKATLMEMAQAAKKLGHKYLGIADHSQSLTVANGLTPERVRKQQEEIDEVNAAVKGIHLFKGTECDILVDGRLDFSDDVLATFDYVVASVHSHFNQSEAEMTARILKAIRNPHVTMLGHATGRLLLRREGYKVNLEAVIQEAAAHNKMIEINASPHRLDMDWIHCKRAKALGVKIVINPDAHSTSDLLVTPYGIDVARRAWLESADVLNTLSLAAVTKYIARRASK